MVLQLMWRRDFFWTWLIPRELWGFLIMCLTGFKSVSSFETLIPIIRAVGTTLVELTGLVNSIIIFLSQTTLLKLSTFLLGSISVILTVLHFLIYLFCVTIIIVLQQMSLHWEILVILLTQFSSTFFETQRMLLFIALLPWSLWSFKRCFVAG